MVASAGDKTIDTRPLTPLLGVPFPPGIAETLGYRGQARLVAFYWYADHLHWDDGRRMVGGAEWHAWQTWVRHPRVAPYFERFELYDDLGEARHWLVLDRYAQRAFMGEAAVARTVIQRQHGSTPENAPPLVLDEEDWERIVTQLQEAMAAFDAQDVARRIADQQARQRALEAWLEALP